MDLESSRLIKNKVAPPPRVKRIATLDDIKRIEPKIESRPSLPVPIPPAGEIKPKPKPKSKGFPFRLVMVVLMFFSIAGLILSLITISRYDKLYKHYYKTSVVNGFKYAKAKEDIKHLNGVNAKIIGDRNNILQAYRTKSHQYNKLQQKENNYKQLLSSKALSLGVVKGDLRVSSAKTEALAVQRELLLSKVQERDQRINELTNQLLASISGQEELAKENIKLSQECKNLREELNSIAKGEK